MTVKCQQRWPTYGRSRAGSEVLAGGQPSERRSQGQDLGGADGCMWGMATAANESSGWRDGVSPIERPYVTDLSLAVMVGGSQTNGIIRWTTDDRIHQNLPFPTLTTTSPEDPQLLRQTDPFSLFFHICTSLFRPT